MMEAAPVKKRGRPPKQPPTAAVPDGQGEPVTKNLGGRPPKYTDDFADQLIEYFNTPPTREAQTQAFIASIPKDPGKLEDFLRALGAGVVSR